MPETNVTTVVSDHRDQSGALVTVFLRGGADGLNLVPPTGDDTYYRLRPTIGIGKASAVKLDDLFGLNPMLKDLAPLFHDGLMSVIQCAGSEDQTRSHFEAEDLMEHGGLAAGGWLGRYLLATRSRDAEASPLSAIAIGSRLPESLRGAPSATAIRSLDDFSLGKETAQFRQLLGGLYGASPLEMLQSAGKSTLKALERIDTLTAGTYSPSHGATYANDSFSTGMQQIAQLIKARVGMEAATIDLGGWDSHLTSATVMDPEMQRLNAGLSAFCRDMGDEMERTTVVVMTEFGRRAAENSARGTDHGRGSVMFVLGGGHEGGKVRTDWPGLTGEKLVGPGDLPVLTNYRNVLAPILRKRTENIDLAKVFPDFTLNPVALFG